MLGELGWSHKYAMLSHICGSRSHLDTGSPKCICIHIRYERNKTVFNKVENRRSRQEKWGVMEHEGGVYSIQCMHE